MDLTKILDNLEDFYKLAMGAVATGAAKPTSVADWIKLLGDQHLIDAAKETVSRFEGEDFTAVADDLEARQVALENGVAFKDLPRDVQTQSVSLGALAQAARGQAVAKKLNQDPLEIALGVLLPVLERALPLVMPLLLAA